MDKGGPHETYGGDFIKSEQQRSRGSHEEDLAKENISETESRAT